MTMKTLSLAFAVLSLATTAAFAKTGWEDDFSKGLAKAKAEKKYALVDFTGSDWCVWCIKLDKEIFSKPAFKNYAKDKLVLVEVDFPQSKQLPKKKQEEHDALAKKYKVQGFPTVLVFDSDGKQVGELGYVEGGPDAFIAQLEKVIKK
jgi:protein disulfide-isomerase